jgi:hypothetical protein
MFADPLSFGPARCGAETAASGCIRSEGDVMIMYHSSATWAFPQIARIADGAFFRRK